ncbi:MAG: amino acid ABC transporter permease [Thermoleophilia bacterium]|nr:amino acid ABC transporter permease [Thermoleophilia bacterium]
MLGGPGGGRSLAIATASTAAFFTAVVLIVVSSPGWPEVRESFFYGPEFRESLPDIASAFTRNVRLFLIAEVFILVFGLLLAILRSLPGPVFFPLRLLSAAYTDVFRGIPTILLIFLLGFGAPALDLQGVPNSPFFWGVVTLVLVYSAYVAEVYRAGIESVHPSQEAAARSLGLNRAQALRYVVVPQAVRRVVPPLLNDFIGLQKDTALVALIGPVEAFRQSQIEVAGAFNYTPYVATAAIFLALTIPMTRFTDWLIARNRRRELARA